MATLEGKQARFKDDLPIGEIVKRQRRRERHEAKQNLKRGNFDAVDAREQKHKSWHQMCCAFDLRMKA